MTILTRADLEVENAAAYLYRAAQNRHNDVGRKKKRTLTSAPELISDNKPAMPDEPEFNEQRGKTAYEQLTAIIDGTGDRIINRKGRKDEKIGAMQTLKLMLLAKDPQEISAELDTPYDTIRKRTQRLREYIREEAGSHGLDQAEIDDMIASLKKTGEFSFQAIASNIDLAIAHIPDDSPDVTTPDGNHAKSARTSRATEARAVR